MARLSMSISTSPWGWISPAVGAGLLVMAIAAAPAFAAASSTTVKAEDVTAKVSVASPPQGSDRRLGVTVDFDIGPGWHIYGEPLPTDFTATQVRFESNLVKSESLKFPAPKPVRFETLGQTFPVYQGNFTVTGDIALKPSLAAGNYQLGGTIEFQECNDSICKIPQRVHFTLPIVIEGAPKA